jgi:transposase-like protein
LEEIERVDMDRVRKLVRDGTQCLVPQSLLEQLTRTADETALGEEMTEHLGYREG